MSADFENTHASPSSTFQGNQMLDRELRRVRRFATMLHDRRSLIDLAAYERELEDQLERAASGNDLLHHTLRRLTIEFH